LGLPLGKRERRNLPEHGNLRPLFPFNRQKFPSGGGVAQRAGVASKNVKYLYDGYDRIIKEDNESFGIKLEYEYNSSGKIDNIFYLNPATQKYEYYKSFNHDDGRLISLTSTNPVSGATQQTGYLYDNFGNVAERGNVPLTYTRTSLLKTYGGNSNAYEYNHQGVRCKKTIGGVTTAYYARLCLSGKSFEICRRYDMLPNN